MSKTYLPAPTDVELLLEQVISEFHPRLENVDLKVGIIMAHAAVDEDTGERKGYALTGHAGAPASATIKIVSLKDRLSKKYDAELMIDGDNWPNLTTAQKIALLDHEMTHLIETEKKDDQGRPVLKMREEDFIWWGFREVAIRHGMNSMEARGFKGIFERDGALLLADKEGTGVLSDKVIEEAQDGDDHDEDDHETKLAKAKPAKTASKKKITSPVDHDEEEAETTAASE